MTVDRITDKSKSSIPVMGDELFRVFPGEVNIAVLHTEESVMSDVSVEVIILQIVVYDNPVAVCLFQCSMVTHCWLLFSNIVVNIIYDRPTLTFNRLFTFQRYLRHYYSRTSASWVKSRQSILMRRLTAHVKKISQLMWR